MFATGCVDLVFFLCRIPPRLSIYVGSCVVRRTVNNYGFGNKL